MNKLPIPAPLPARPPSRPQVCARDGMEAVVRYY